MSDEPQSPAPEVVQQYEETGESEAFGALTRDLPEGSLQDAELRKLLSDRAKDLAALTRGEPSELEVQGQRWVHVLDKVSDRVGWISGADYDSDPGAYDRADESPEIRELMAQRVLTQTAADAQEKLATLGALGTFAASTAIEIISG